MSKKYVPSWEVRFDILSILSEGSLSTTSIIYKSKYRKDTVRAAITYMSGEESQLIEVEEERTKYAPAFWRISDKGRNVLNKYKKRHEDDEKTKTKNAYISGFLRPNFVFQGPDNKFYHLEKRSLVLDKGEERLLYSFDDENQLYHLSNGSKIKVNKPIHVHQNYIKYTLASESREYGEFIQMERDKHQQIKELQNQVEKLKEDLSLYEGKNNNFDNEKAQWEKERESLERKLFEVNQRVQEYENKDGISTLEGYLIKTNYPDLKKLMLAFPIPNNLPVTVIGMFNGQETEIEAVINDQQCTLDKWGFQSHDGTQYQAPYGLPMKVNRKYLNI